MTKKLELIRDDLEFGFKGTFGHWCYFHNEDRWESGYFKVTYGYVSCLKVVEKK